MSIITLLIAAGISIVISLIVSAFLSNPLRQLLGELCGTQQRALFWHHYTSLMLMVVPLLTVLLFLHSDSAIDSELLRRTLICVLAGLVVALTTIGFKLSGFIRKDLHQPPSRVKG